MNTKVSVIITAHNYGKYLNQCIESVLVQTYNSYEIVVVNDGSEDNTAELLNYYALKHPQKVKVVTLSGVGLPKAVNIGIRNSCGEYIIRLDADDYFDENILLVEANILDRSPNIHMVYSDYYRINKHGEIIDSYRLQKVNSEVKLFDRSPLAAGAMYRRKCYDAIGGYNEELQFQEDYDFWIRFIDKFNAYNVNVPLMYYRKHRASMSNNFDKRMKARQQVKEKFVDQKGCRKDKHFIGVIPAMGLFRDKEKLALKPFNGKPLIAYTIEEALKSKHLDRVIVSTEDQDIAEVAKHFGADVPFLRPIELARTNIPVRDVLRHMVGVFKEKGEAIPNLIAVLHYYTPFRRKRHIDEAIDTLLLYNTDSVISVVEDITFHWKPGKNGLVQVSYPNRLLREDKETIYKENAAIYVIRTVNLVWDNHLGKSIGNIEMSPKESWRIESEFDSWVAEKMLQKNIF